MNTLGPLPSGLFTTTNPSWTHHPKIAAETKFGKRYWKVSGHLGGTKSFSTWERARDYALAKVELAWEQGRCPNAGNMCNCIGVCQPRRVWKVVGY